MLFLNETPELSELEFDIYNYIMENIEKVEYMSVRDLAQASHTSSASIMRFCKAFQCSGYSEFKFRLKQFQIQAKKDAPKVHHPDEMALINFLSNTTNIAFQEKLDRAADMLIDKELVLFVGLGSSKLTANYGAHYFSSLFSMSMTLEDTMNYPVNHLSESMAEKMAIILFSVSGETEHIIEFMQRYHTSKCKFISITNSSRSPIAKHSDLNFSYFLTQERIEYADITSQVPAIYIIESIGKAVRNRKFK